MAASTLAAVAQAATAASSQAIPALLSKSPPTGPLSGFLVPKLRQPSLPSDALLPDCSPQQRQRQPALQVAQVWLKVGRT